MNYKGYEAEAHYSEDDQIFWGEVVNITPPTTILFESENAKNLQKEFKTSVNFYLQVCKDKGIAPKKPVIHKLSLKLTKSLHSRIIDRAKTQGISINNYVTKTLKAGLGQRAEG